MKNKSYLAPEATAISLEIEDAVLQNSGSLNDIGEGDSLTSSLYQ